MTRILAVDHLAWKRLKTFYGVSSGMRRILEQGGFEEGSDPYGTE
jgi:hypothetical protein